MKKIYLIDFDGTITKKDTLDFVAKRFFPDKYREWGKKIMEKEYTVREWLTAFEETFNVPKEEYDRALKELEIDDTFLEFIKNNECAVVSGGFDYNIKEILARYLDTEKIKIYANELVYIDNNKVVINKIHENKNCSSCAVCKNNILKKYRENYDEIIFIGDGITDVCAAQISDKIYAKKGLYLDKYLTERNIDHEIFNRFSEIK